MRPIQSALDEMKSSGGNKDDDSGKKELLAAMKKGLATARSHITDVLDANTHDAATRETLKTQLWSVVCGYWPNGPMKKVEKLINIAEKFAEKEKEKQEEQKQLTQ